VKTTKKKQSQNTIKNIKSKELDKKKELSKKTRKETQSPDNFEKLLRCQVLFCLPEVIRTDKKIKEMIISLMQSIEPNDAIESMITAQMIAVHIASMHMSSQCMTNNQTAEGMKLFTNLMTKLMRTSTNQVEALQRYRGKGKQVIQVQHVQVNDGGQAIVGNVQGGGGNG